LTEEEAAGSGLGVLFVPSRGKIEDFSRFKNVERISEKGDWRETVFFKNHT